MTVTLDLAPEQVELAQEIAEARDTDINALLAQVIADFLEEQEDLADAHARLQELQAGTTTTRPWSEVRAELLAKAKD